MKHMNILKTYLKLLETFTSLISFVTIVTVDFDT